MEYCDLYDENHNPLGRVHNRKEKLNPGEFITVTGIWIFDSSNRIFLTKRDPSKSYAPNLWENTGGHVMAGETSAAAVVRELKEETGIEVTEEELGYIGSARVWHFFSDNFYIRKDFPASRVKLQEGETCDAKWVTYDEFLRMTDAGEVAPSVAEHLDPMRESFEIALLGRKYSKAIL